MTDQLAALYPAHLHYVVAQATAALEFGRCDHLLVAAGAERMRFLDDMPVPYFVNPQFKWWLPLTQHADSWLLFTPGKKPILIYHQPADYWHLPPADPAGYWAAHFDIRIVREAADAVRHFPADLSRAAILGEDNCAIAGLAPNNPAAVLNALAIARTRKTEYEIHCMRMASAIGVRAHRAAATAFRERRSEFDIHGAFVAATGHTENEMPYRDIVGLNEHGAVLHYQYKDRVAPAEHRTLLIDAGAQVNGYASDITRTYGHGDHDFSHLLEAVNHAQMGLCDGVRVGQSYPELHLKAHRDLAQILHEQDYVRMSAESMVESGVSSVFFPHGLGHFIGLQVHDVAGFMKDRSGELLAKPAGHPYLRLTRTLEADNVLTIEPGIYFIPMLLAGLRAGPHSGAVNWNKVERMLPFGGIRVEDDVRVRASGAPENLTRDAYHALAEGA